MMPSIADIALGNMQPCASVEMARPVMNLRMDEDEPTQLRALPPPSPAAPLVRGDALRDKLLRELKAKFPARFYLEDVRELGVGNATASKVTRDWIADGTVVVIGRIRRGGFGQKSRIAFEWCK